MTPFITTVVCAWGITWVPFIAAYAIPATLLRHGRIESRFHIFPDPGTEESGISESTITDIVVVLILALLLVGGIVWFIKKHPYRTGSPPKRQTRIDSPTSMSLPPTPLVAYPSAAHVEVKKTRGAASAYPTANA